MLIETALPAVAIALVELVSPTCVDLMLAKFGRGHEELLGSKSLMNELKRRPRGGGAGGHHKGIRGGTGGLAGFLQGQAKGGRMMTPLGTVGAIADVAIDVPRGLLFYPWIIGVGTSFIANWASLLYEAQKCAEPGAGYVNSPAACNLTLPGNEAAVYTPASIARPCFQTSPTGIVVHRGCYVTMSCTGHFTKAIGGGPATASLFLRDLVTGQQVGMASAEGGPVGSATGAAHATAEKVYDNGGAYQFRYIASQDVVSFTGTISVSGYGRKVSFPAFSCVDTGQSANQEIWKYINPFS